MNKTKEWKRSHRFNRHHIQNKVRGGSSDPRNLILFDTERHAAWHFLFGNLNFQEVAGLLIRVQSLKRRGAA